MFFPSACLFLCSLFYVASSFFSATFETKKTMERPARCELVVDSGFFCRDENNGKTKPLSVLLFDFSFLSFYFCFVLLSLYLTPVYPPVYFSFLFSKKKQGKQLLFWFVLRLRFLPIVAFSFFPVSLFFFKYGFLASPWVFFCGCRVL